MAFPSSSSSSSSSLLLPLLLLLLPSSQSQLNPDFYAKTCPNANAIIQQAVTEKQSAAPVTAPGVLRVFFQDCMMGGCDASLLIASNAFQKSERDTDINFSLPGDAFDAITRAKTTLELQCPGVVSCSDILAVATRDLIKIVGGPHYNVGLGRKDSLASVVDGVDAHVGAAKMPLDQLISLYASKGLNVQEMVALTGAHTIGSSHCAQFADRLFHFSKTAPTDPTYNPKYAEGLKALCANYTTRPGVAAFNDAMTSGKFDNMYFKNIQQGLALLKSDQLLAEDNKTKPFVDQYAADQNAFFDAFAKAMEKVSAYKVKTGNQGDVRRRCDQFNELVTN